MIQGEGDRPYWNGMLHADVSPIALKGSKNRHGIDDYTQMKLEHKEKIKMLSKMSFLVFQRQAETKPLLTKNT